MQYFHSLGKEWPRNTLQKYKMLYLWCILKTEQKTYCGFLKYMPKNMPDFHLL